MSSLIEKKCIPCEGGTQPFDEEKIQEYLKKVEGWKLRGTTLITKTFRFKTFREAMDFVNQVANLAEAEQHHPDIIIRYRNVTFELTTHAIKGLSENDFIMASKIDWLYQWEEKVIRAILRKFLTIKFLLLVVVLLTAFLLWKKYL